MGATLEQKISALQPALAEAGLVIVPKEPTEEMITAGLIPTAAWQDIRGTQLTVNREKMRLRYMAMVAAAERATFTAVGSGAAESGDVTVIAVEPDHQK